MPNPSMSKERSSWPRFFAFFIPIPPPAIRRNTPATIFPSSRPIRTVRRCLRPARRWGSSLESSSAASPVNSDFVRTLKRTVTNSWSRATRIARILSSIVIARCGYCHLAAFLAGLPDGRADCESEEAQTRADGRNWLGSRRPQGGCRTRRYGRRRDVLQQHQRRRARRHDGAFAPPPLSSLARDRSKGRVEYRRLREPKLRSRRHAVRHDRSRPDRPCRATPPETLRREASL